MPAGLNSGGVIHTHLTLIWFQALADLFYSAQLKYSQAQNHNPDDPNQEVTLYMTKYRKLLAEYAIRCLQESQAMEKLQRRRNIDL
jgi:hypothetical protein